MTMQIRDAFDISVERFWESVFFDEEYNRRLYLDALGFTGFELRENARTDGGWRRVLWAEPGAEAPAPVRKVAGSIGYTETGRYDPADGVYRFQMRTDRASERIDMRGRIWAEARSDATCERVVELEVAVDIPVIGGSVERFIERTNRESYRKAAAFTERFIDEKGLRES
jgi:hypothetical protein